MLADLGLGTDAEAVYQQLLKHSVATAVEISSQLKWSSQRVHTALEELVRLSLVRPSLEAPGALRLIHPEIGLGMLLQRREADLLERQRAMVDTRAAISQMVVEYGETRPHSDRVRVQALTDLDAIYACSERLSQTAVSEVVVVAPSVFRRPEGRIVETVDTRLLSRDVTARCIFLDSIVNDAESISRACALIDAGAQIRTAPYLPPRMTIYDRTTAILDLDPECPSTGALVLTGAAPVAALHALFENVWRQASPLGEGEQEPHAELTRQERVVTELLAAGYTDEVVARKLGVSVRTARRIVAFLMKRLRASSRFQAGVRAAERGWLSSGRV
ncbi:regulatory LuxR family protein [Micromonospora sp. A202]|uniref:helix-turn-helix transcriptional regulator n=1 Tax=Micromonospora sp. A202 TaxID=2572899 RepID=UPI0011749444|nr:helix-turn-helix domain-containing protein [Micromonospora sp. A202]TQJ23637.1 regulatory LuxR family protein [Micromonospora sp. A202]